MNTDDTRPSGMSSHTAQSEQTMAAAAISQKEFDTRMAAIMAVYEEIAEESKEIKARFKEISESQKETDRQVEATSAQVEATSKRVEATSEQIKKTSKDLKRMYTELNSNWSRLVESLVRGKLVELLQSRGIDATATFPRIKAHFIDHAGTRKDKEFDILVRNGTDVVAFEVKTTLRTDDVRNFLAVMRNISRFFPEYASRRAYGGVAYINEESEAGRFAAKQGLYVVRATGDSASIENNAAFKPKLFSDTSSTPVSGHLRAVPDC